jgi:ribosomal protein L15E
MDKNKNKTHLHLKIKSKERLVTKVSNPKRTSHFYRRKRSDSMKMRGTVRQGREETHTRDNANRYKGSDFKGGD